jgi:hypothetical protein
MRDRVWARACGLDKMEEAKMYSRLFVQIPRYPNEHVRGMRSTSTHHTSAMRRL